MVYIIYSTTVPNITHMESFWNHRTLPHTLSATRLFWFRGNLDCPPVLGFCFRMSSRISCRIGRLAWFRSHHLDGKRRPCSNHPLLPLALKLTRDTTMNSSAVVARSYGVNKGQARSLQRNRMLSKAKAPRDFEDGHDRKDRKDRPIGQKLLRKGR